MIDEKKLNDAASSCSRVSCPIEPLRGIMLQGFLSGAAWAESHLRETGQLLDWRPYPEEKPEGDGGDYFIAFRHAGPEKASVIATHGHKSNMWLEAKVYAWAYMPKPPQPDEL